MHLKKLMTGVMIFFLLGCFLCACGKTKDQTRKTTKDTNKQIIIGGDNYPPFNYTDENGNPAGIDVELAKEAFHRMGYKPVFVNIDWENKKKPCRTRKNRLHMGVLFSDWKRKRVSLGRSLYAEPSGDRSE